MSAMTDLERRALLGDAEAQRECTEKGIVLACWRCGGETEIKQVSTVGRPLYAVSCKKHYCGAYGCAHRTEKEAILYWNTRPAPPIGRCGECAYGIPYKEEHIICKGRWTDKTYNDFCSDFVPKGGEEDGTAAD